MIIDSHQHFWKLDRGDYDWLKKDSKLYRDFLPEDLEPFLKPFHVEGTLLVQAAPTYEETLYLLSLYEQYDWILGVVGWLDLSSPRFSAQLETLKNKAGFVGIRPMLQDLADPKWILQKQVMENLEVMMQYDIPLDLLINETHISSILTVMKTLPKLRAVIDHLAKPVISENALDGWKAWMQELANHQTLYCKLSGLLTQTEQVTWRVKDFEPFVRYTSEIFGPSRVMFGSDWPVSLQGGSYGDSIHIIEETLPADWSERERQQTFRENARSFYKLKERREKSE